MEFNATWTTFATHQGKLYLRTGHCSYRNRHVLPVKYAEGLAESNTKKNLLSQLLDMEYVLESQLINWLTLLFTANSE
jgi:hypothetical protein